MPDEFDPMKAMKAFAALDQFLHEQHSSAGDAIICCITMARFICSKIGHPELFDELVEKSKVFEALVDAALDGKKADPS
jgi:hypothetical protein